MKKLMSIFTALLFVFALSSCTGGEESTCKQDPACADDAACEASTAEGCKGYVEEPKVDPKKKDPAPKKDPEPAKDPS